VQNVPVLKVVRWFSQVLLVVVLKFHMLGHLAASITFKPLALSGAILKLLLVTDFHDHIEEGKSFDIVEIPYQ